MSQPLPNTLYLWDMAGTLFHEKWDAQRTGFSTYDEYVVDLYHRPLSAISDREYEEAYEIPYRKGGHFQLRLQPRVQQTLDWTTNNETFTTGTSEQLEWRADYLTPRARFDIRQYIAKINSTFDFGETNKKTSAMLVQLLGEKYAVGYRTIVYADDKLENCKFFLAAAQTVQKKQKDFVFRIYHVRNDRQGIQPANGFTSVGTLHDLLKRERVLAETSR